MLPRRNVFRTVSHDRVVSGIYLFGGICKKPQVQRVLAESVDVLRQVWAQPREGRLIELVPLLGKLPQDARLGLHVMEYQAVRDQVVVLDQLALLVAVVLGDQALAAEEEPLGEPVERLALVGRGLPAASWGRVRVLSLRQPIAHSHEVAGASAQVIQESVAVLRRDHREPAYPPFSEREMTSIRSYDKDMELSTLFVGRTSLIPAIGIS